jgi:hypothetical protein
VIPSGRVPATLTLMTIAEELEGTGGVNALAADLRTTFLLLNEGRYRALTRMFGISRADANIVTLVALGALAQASHEQFQRMMRMPGGPTRGDAELGLAALNELAYGIGGPASRQMPFFGGLLVLAVAGAMSGPTAVRSVRAMRQSVRRMHQASLHRYGHLIGRPHPHHDPHHAESHHAA